MTEDIIKRKILIGKSKREVLQILGDTDSTGAILYYSVGITPYGGIDDDIIEIKIENGKVVNVKQRST